MSTGASIDLRQSTDPDAYLILDWPDTFLESLKRRMLAVHSNSALADAELADLGAYQLLDRLTSKPTALGEHLIDLLVREGWQEGDELKTYLKFLPQGFGGSAIEVGCGTGWALRSLGPARGGRRVGLDIDAKAVALGYRLAKQENHDCCFYCCSAHSLPFPDNAFDLIICRNALTYMHQRTALREMSRVLNHGGLLFLRFENIWYDLLRLSHLGVPRAVCCRLRDFLYGLIRAIVGWQPMPGNTFRGGRAFGTLRRLRKELTDCGCEVLCVGESRNCPRFAGLSTQTSLLARRI